MILNSDFWAIFGPIEHSERGRPPTAFLCRTGCGKCGKMAALSAEIAEIASFILTMYFETLLRQNNEQLNF